jgi:hypothetical protein
MTNKKPKISLHCDVEGCTFKTKAGFFAAQELGRHKKFVHGIVGATAAKKKSQLPTPIPIAHTENPEPSVGKKRGPYNKSKSNIAKGASSNGEAIALITTGKIISFCEAEAEKYNISKRAFTQRCAELFLASQVW